MHSRLMLALTLLPIATTLSGCAGHAEAAENASTESAVPVTVTRVSIVPRNVVIAASGTIEARATTDLAFQVPGRVALVGVEEGQAVRTGQVMAHLDPIEYRLAYEQAVLTHARAADEAKRARMLQSVDGIAPNDLDKLINAENQAIVSATLAEKRLFDTRLTAPLSGVIARRTIERGEMVSAGIPAFSIVDLDVVHVRVAVPESDVGLVAVNHPATISVSSLGRESFEGRVRLVGVAADRTTGTYAVEIAVPNPGHRLKAGMIAEATIRTPQQVNRLTVPGAAIVRDAEGATRLFVYVSDEQRVRARRVDVIGMHGTDVEVTGGVAEGDLVVIGGQHSLREGMKARPTSENVVIIGTPIASITTDTQPEAATTGGSSR
jgi:RND family efflux transporter MFP subunit